MFKLLKNIICTFVYSKGLRNAIRGNYVKHYFSVKHSVKNFKDYKYDLAFVAIVKNEGAYLPEWIEFHKLVGVKKFYIYDNESTDNTKEILSSYIQDGTVTYEYIKGRGMQKFVYNDAIDKYKNICKWMGFIDLDEFVTPIKYKTITELFDKDFKKYYGVGINWLIYGDNNHKKKTKGLVIERFTKHAEKNFEMNRNIKSIINPRYCTLMRNHHAYFIGNASCVNTNGKKIKGWRTNPCFDKIRINHYWSKSYEEYIQKKFKGDAWDGTKIRDIDDTYKQANQNVEEDSIMEKYIPLIKTELKKRNIK